jgi:hypothetical protein
LFDLSYEIDCLDDRIWIEADTIDTVPDKELGEFGINRRSLAANRNDLSFLVRSVD